MEKKRTTQLSWEIDIICSEFFVQLKKQSDVNLREEQVHLFSFYLDFYSSVQVLLHHFQPFNFFPVIQHFNVQLYKHLSMQKSRMKMWCDVTTTNSPCRCWCCRAQHQSHPAQRMEQVYSCKYERSVSQEKSGGGVFQTTDICSMCTCEWRRAGPVPPQSSLLQTGCP